MEVSTESGAVYSLGISEVIFSLGDCAWACVVRANAIAMDAMATCEIGSLDNIVFSLIESWLKKKCFVISFL